ncbi:hypothetical protein PGT21_021144 [Puccinia graminis f. sp. tritici]|uniref:Uncharacterized protein n=1 Tax=Puccinia graminis f. sp. tritici TaxID=56615 RepID=A0A5B0PDA0_PUCGR|nr:hypothetical protein PGT21_021144 [Puccinia graminis f. sp. tritici]KAA1117218.1 hypothetical protein PGTUg99_037094 [Puccinia graminis f. sp. tritici]
MEAELAKTQDLKTNYERLTEEHQNQNLVPLYKEQPSTTVAQPILLYMDFGVPKCLKEKNQENLPWEGQDPRKI